MLRWLRNSFFTGIVIATPVGVTLFLIISFVGFVDAQIKPLIPPQFNPENSLPFAIPGLGVLFAVLLLTLVGALAANVMGRGVFGFSERMLNRVPLVRNIYGAVKQLVQTLAQGQSNSFKEVVLVEYPKDGLYAVAFVSAEGRGPVKDKVGDDVVGIFVPSTPNPTSGFLLYTLRRNIIPVDLSVEEAAKLIVSFGLVTPDKLPEDVQDSLPDHVKGEKTADEESVKKAS